MNKKLLKKTALTLLAILLITGAFFYYAGWELNRYAAAPALPDAVVCRVVVSPGQGVYKIAQLLAACRIIERPLEFRLLARINGFDKRIKAGEYRLSGAMTPNEIFDKLVRGDVVLYRLTIPEGYTQAQIAELVEDADLETRDAFLRALSDIRVLKQLGIAADSFEGYLFPDTYFFPRGVTAEKIIGRLVARFHQVFTSERLKQAEALGLSIHQVVTLAAIIEKETGAPEERPLISSVFHNRLKLGMRLESDPTVIYGIKDFNGNITRKDLAEHTPYNTYQIKGLPPGPIANPGEKAIEAALYPADTAYLFFVARKDHTHYFSTNLDDHNRAVARYQLH